VTPYPPAPPPPLVPGARWTPPSYVVRPPPYVTDPLGSPSTIQLRSLYWKLLSRFSDALPPLTLHVEYAERGEEYGILFIFCLFCEYIPLEYVGIHGLTRGLIRDALPPPLTLTVPASRRAPGALNLWSVPAVTPLSAARHPSTRHPSATPSPSTTCARLPRRENWSVVVRRVASGHTVISTYNVYV